jgi:hypothetical protein
VRSAVSSLAARPAGRIAGSTVRVIVTMSAVTAVYAIITHLPLLRVRGSLRRAATRG